MTARTLTAVEVADLLGKTPAWWLAQARQKKVPHRRIGRSVLFTEDDIDEYLATSRVTPIDPLQSAVPSRRRRAS